MLKLNNVNAACRLRQLPFYAAGTHGLYGFAFADLIRHTFTVTRAKSNVPTRLGPESATRSVVAVSSTRDPATGKVTETVTKTEVYSPLQLANTSPLPPFHLASLRRKQAVTPLLPCLRALWEFQKVTGRPAPLTSPPSSAATSASSTATTDPASPASDMRLFVHLATHKTQELRLPAGNLPAAFVRAFLHDVAAELAPVAALLGGSVAQDVINVVGAREQPLQNWLFVDGDACRGPVYALHPLFPHRAGEVEPAVVAAEEMGRVGVLAEKMQVGGTDGTVPLV